VRNHTFRTISQATASKPALLAANYGVDVQNGVTRICAYDQQGLQQKEQFLRDAARYCRAIGRTLGQYYGFTEWTCNRNEGGIAVSGEVYAQYKHPTIDRWIFVWLESTGLRFTTPLRMDGVVVTARWRKAVGHYIDEGPNTHYSANLPSDYLARRLLPLVGIHP